MDALKYAGFGALGFWCLWVLFLATMNLAQSKAEGKLNGFALWAGYTVLAVGLLVDLVVQLTVATLLWLELPRELTVSERVARLCRTSVAAGPGDVVSARALVTV